MGTEALHEDERKKLFAIIELANCSPAGGLPDIGWPPADLNANDENAWWEQQTASLDPKLRNYIGVIDYQTEFVYLELQQAVKAVRQLAAHGRDLKPFRVLAQFQLGLAVNNDGVIVFLHNRLIYSILHIYGHRIRLCDCGNVFWAERKDQPSCGRKCANARRVKNWRENYPDKYKQQRYLQGEKQSEG